MLVCTWVTGVNGRLDGTRVLINGVSKTLNGIKCFDHQVPNGKLWSPTYTTKRVPLMKVSREKRRLKFQLSSEWRLSSR